MLSLLRSLTCAALNKFAYPGNLKNKRVPKFLTSALGSWNPLFGWTPLSDPLFAIQFGGPAYRGDMFRVLVPTIFRGSSVLYADLDVYFSQPFLNWPLQQSFTYRWEKYPWANSAILFYHEDREETSEFLLGELSSGRSALPWFLFSDEGCEKAGIRVFEADQFDPAWSSKSVSIGDIGLFFRKSDATESLMSEIKTSFLAVHWHNQWKVAPEVESAFNLLLKEET